MKKKTHFGHFKKALLDAFIVRAVNECHEKWVKEGLIKERPKKEA
jgi:hypothetical protein